MIKKIEMLTCICDNCGLDIADIDGEYCAFDPDFLNEVLENSDWIGKNREHFCKDCYSFDENDQIIINIERKKDNEKATI